jgi:ketosteroid isomerase-like protein
MTLAAVILVVAVMPMSSAQPAADEAELQRLEAVWNAAHVRGDVAALDRLWADDIVIAVQGMPLMSKQDALAITRSGKLAFDRYETTGTRVRVYGDAAVVTGRLHRSRRMGERQAEDHWYFTKTYARRDGRWMVVSWHASDAPR